jgi:mannose/fructose-specific phosphotransferase system component IIA
MKRALLVTHGNLGAELLSTAELIVGPQKGVSVLSNNELSSESLEDAIQTELATYGGDETVIFVDVAGGSCLCACRVAEGDEKKVKVISGVNLPMVLEFFHYRDRLPFEELAERVAAKGRGGIQTL